MRPRTLIASLLLLVPLALTGCSAANPAAKATPHAQDPQTKLTGMLQTFETQAFRHAYAANGACLKLYEAKPSTLSKTQQLAEGSCFADDGNVSLEAPKLLAEMRGVKTPASLAVEVSAIEDELKAFPSEGDLFHLCANDQNDLPTLSSEKCAIALSDQRFGGYIRLATALNNWPSGVQVQDAS